MYSFSDFEHLFICYKAESVSLSESLQYFSFRYRAPYNLFQKWYKDTCHKLVHVQVEGHTCVVVEGISELPLALAMDTALQPIRILAEFRMCNDLHLRIFT